jgi:hypothetical protein
MHEYFGLHLEEIVSFLTDNCVLLSLARNSKDIGIFISQTPSQGRLSNDDRFRSQNIVCPEIFHDLYTIFYNASSDKKATIAL